MRVAVLGAGLAGLTAAWRLARHGHDVVVWEATDRAGGVVGSIRDGEWLVETGPNSVAGLPPALDALLADLDLAPLRREAAPAARRRWVVRGGQLVEIPSSPADLLTTRVLSPAAKLRAAQEPFIPALSEQIDESIAAFTRRRLGDEVLDYLVNPFIAGIFAGDPEQLSVAETFPSVARMEREHGSIIRGMMKRVAEHGLGDGNGGAGGEFGRALWSFGEGLGALPAALARTLGPRLRLGWRATRVAPAGGGWMVQGESGSAERVDAVVSALPAWALHGVLPADLQAEAAPLRTVHYAPVALVALGYARAAVPHALDGFGFLAPDRERRWVLGTLFSSSLFPARAPAGHVLLTSFVGGVRAPALVDRSDEDLADVVHGELAALLGVTARPVYARVVRWPAAIPQYTVGYRRIREAIAALEARWPGLVMTGSYRDGVAVPDVVASGIAAAERLHATAPAPAAAGVS